MIDYRFFPEWNLHHVRAEDRCTLLALVEYGMELGQSSGPEANLDLPALFDLRAIELGDDSSHDIKKAIRLRKSLKENTGNNPCAYVVGSVGSFGIMRMYGIYAELEGLRREEMTLITEDIDEAIDWIVGYLDISDTEARAVRVALEARTPATVR
ncbi:hypothetical protein R5H30_12700 [Sulfitobacter sp. D35]|uniref:hypothetical protein n=1 Tax=Sulfitobacter sp. D35 TaxID=3083252 RepID=UPI00296EFE34|nr:hypothetical protein [Sulfitobacter sp. D35]MDW4498847.1 hypothetical protein [Sulfitobacter sp. D35]